MAFLLQHHADVNVQDINGNTALIHAADSCNYDAVELLLRAKANRYITNKLGETALSIAIERKNEFKKDDWLTPVRDYFYPVMYIDWEHNYPAAIEGYKKIIKLLKKDEGCNVS